MASSVWHPNTQMREWDDFAEIKSARGVWLVDSHGNKMIDAVASMWCNVWGHSDPQLVGSIIRQSKKLQHAPLFNLTHAPAKMLAKSLVELSPGMHRVMYSDNGSSAMEIAIKMAIQYWKNVGEKRTAIASLYNGYHGDTFGAMSIGYVPEFFGNFKGHLFPATRFHVPDMSKKGRTMEQCLGRIEARLCRGDVACFVMESGAQLAGGVNIYPKGFQRKVRGICKKNNVLFILDEVATGFGRLGSMVEYASQGGTPDIVAYGKMLTGGYLAMAATLASKKVHDAFLGTFEQQRHLFHGHTYSGNPLAASVALENLDMYRSRDLIARIKDTSRVFSRYHDQIYGTGMVCDIRHKGMLMGIELSTGRKSKASPNKILFEAGRRNGIYLRTLGNIVMLVPPLAISESELGMLLERTIDTINSVKKSFHC